MYRTFYSRAIKIGLLNVRSVTDCTNRIQKHISRKLYLYLYGEFKNYVSLRLEHRLSYSEHTWSRSKKKSLPEQLIARQIENYTVRPKHDEGDRKLPASTNSEQRSHWIMRHNTIVSKLKHTNLSREIDSSCRIARFKVTHRLNEFARPTKTKPRGAPCKIKIHHDSIRLGRGIARAFTGKREATTLKPDPYAPKSPALIAGRAPPSPRVSPW